MPLQYLMKNKAGCKRGTLCDVLHFNRVPKNINSTDNNKDGTKAYKCVGCETNWTDKTCVMEHMVQNKTIYFCLNCEDWLKHKSKVLHKNWSLFNKDGYLRYDV